MTREQARIGARVRVRTGTYNEWNGLTGRIVGGPVSPSAKLIIVKFDSVPPGFDPGTYRAFLSSLVLAETPRERNQRLLSKQRNNL
jgi:hypothetical protein